MSRISRAFCLVAVALAAGSSIAAEPRCTAHPGFGDLLDVECRVDPSKRYVFEVDFAGGHDDTSASMSLSLGEQPLACEPGSKTSLFGEDGDVSLTCAFTPAAQDGTMRASVRWSHARYIGFGLAPARD